MQKIIRHRHISLFAFLLLCLLLCGTPFFAQTVKKNPNVSAAAKQRQHVLDSTRAAQQALIKANQALRQEQITETREIQKKKLDSMRNTRQQGIDSIKSVRQKTTDSLTHIRKYRESKRYKDSVVKSREQKINGIRAVQKGRMDSLKAARQHSTDSMIAIRKRSTDSIKTIQKRRTDSLGIIRKYRESKRFQDSVIIVRKVRMDSIKAVRKLFSDSVFTARKHTIDSSKTARKHIADSATAVRKKITDSLTAVRKVRADKLLKANADKAKVAKAKEKQQQSLLDMKLEMKIKSKRSVYSNEKMLKKKWSLPRQVVQNTFTRYNYYFNAKRKMDEAELNMQRIAKDNFNTEISLFTFDPNRDSTILSADMDSIIRKASLGIQIHDPRAKWGDDLYLLLGKSYYYKGGYENANASFRYIVAMRAKEKLAKAQKSAYSNKSVRGKKEPASVIDEEKKGLLEFLKHESANNEALLWVARTMTQSGKYNDAESVLDLLANDAKFPEDMRGRLALEQAFLELKQNNKRNAADKLVLVAADKGQEYFMRRRAAFLAGQLLQEQGKYDLSAQQFAVVTDLQPKIEMDFYARKNRAYSLMLGGNNQEEAIASLKYMLNDGKYAAYNEQIYFILGRLSMNNNNLADAETYLKKSLASSKSTKKQKASSFALLGNIYYKTGSWDAAKQSYDSASYFSTYALDDKDVIIAKQRSKVLDQVAVPERTIRSQDSLLLLAAMTEKEQRSVVRKYIRSLEQKRADSILKAENAATGQAAEPEVTASGAMTWYFSNPSLVQQGANEFKRKWGSRPLVDNWQRSATLGNRGGNVTNSGDPNSNDIADNAEGNNDNGLPTEESLLAFIPNTQPRKDAAQRVIQRAYVDLGTAYVKSLEDYPRAGRTFDTLDKRYTEHPFRDEELYNRYLLSVRQNNLSKAQEYSTMLQQNYPSSKYTDLVKPSTDTADNATQVTAALYYDETYNMLQQRQYGDVISRSRTGRQRYKDEQYTNRFRIVEAMAVAGQGNYKQADTLLTDFIQSHQTDSLRIWADNVLRYVKEQRKADSIAHPVIIDSAKIKAVVPVSATTNQPTVTANGATPVTPPVPGAATLPVTGIVTDSTKQNIPDAYTYKANEEHFFIFYFKQMSSKVMGVKAGLTDFNTMKFGEQNLTANLEIIQSYEGMITVRKFQGVGQAKIYMNEFRRNPNITREFGATDFQVLIISANNYRKLMADKNMAAYLVFYRSKY